MWLLPKTVQNVDRETLMQVLYSRTITITASGEISHLAQQFHCHIFLPVTDTPRLRQYQQLSL